MTTTQTPTQRRTALNFDMKYNHKGGLVKLLAMAEEHLMLREMADHFGISIQRTGKILETVLGAKYSIWLMQRGVLHAPGKVSASNSDGDAVRPTVTAPKLHRLRKGEL